MVNTQPAMTLGNDTDVPASVAAAFQAAGNQSQARPQMLIFVLPSKNTDMYVRIKKSTDCRYGMMSQCVQAAHVLKNQPQYHSNVCMKFNAKLGGTTNKVALVSYFRIYYVLDTNFVAERESSYARSLLQAYHDHWSRCQSCCSGLSSAFLCCNDDVTRSILLSLRCSGSDKWSTCGDDCISNHCRHDVSNVQPLVSECR